MKEDHFEQQLQRQGLQAMPPSWRTKILSAAHEASVAQSALPAQSAAHPEAEPVTSVSIPSFWSRLFWPHPKAWAALAAVWVMIFCIYFADRESEPMRAPAQMASPSPEMRELLKKQERLLAELIQEPAQPPEATEPKRPQPHSRRNDNFVNI